jgi:hypothetical protein
VYFIFSCAVCFLDRKVVKLSHILVHFLQEFVGKAHHKLLKMFAQFLHNTICFKFFDPYSCCGLCESLITLRRCSVYRERSSLYLSFQVVLFLEVFSRYLSVRQFYEILESILSGFGCH